MKKKDRTATNPTYKKREQQRAGVIPMSQRLKNDDEPDAEKHPEEQPKAEQPKPGALDDIPF